MESLKLAKMDMQSVNTRLVGLSGKINPAEAYEGVALHGYMRCGDGTCANTNSADCCRNSRCSGWD